MNKIKITGKGTKEKKKKGPKFKQKTTPQSAPTCHPKKI
jgi:hypothetical protein